MRAGPDGSADAGVRSAAVRLAAHWGGLPERAVDVLPTPSGALLALAGEVVVKVHRAGTDRRALEARLRLVADPALRDVFLAPLRPGVIALEAGVVASEEHGADDGARPGSPPGPPLGLPLGSDRSGGRLATVWPRVGTVPRDPSAVPWAETGELLARLHMAPVPAESSFDSVPIRDSTPIPPHGAVARLRRALDGLARVNEAPTAEQEAAARVVARAAGALPAEAWLTRAPGRPLAVVHGDWHLGQLGHFAQPGQGAKRNPGHPSRRGAVGRWLLLDPDDVGVGDPAWDFARPAALLAAGLIDPRAWKAFVDAYRGAGGPALPPPPSDPWPPLEPVARAGVVQAAAAVLRRAITEGHAFDDADRGLLAVCDALAGQQLADQEEKNRRPNPPLR